MLEIDMNDLASATELELQIKLDNIRAQGADPQALDSNTRAMLASDAHMILEELRNRQTAEAVTAAIEPGGDPHVETMPSPVGVKHDDDKVRLDLIPSEAMFALGVILTYGADKYTARNWEKGMRWGRLFAAAMRHLWDWWGGKGPTSVNFAFGSLDTDTQYSHLWHALACVVFLVTYEERSIGDDDRPKG